MKKFGKAMLSVLRWTIFTAAVVCLIWVNLTFIYANVGNLIGTVGFGLVALVALFPKGTVRLIKRMWSKVLSRIALCFIAGLLAVAVGICATLSVMMLANTFKPLDRVEAVLVLGCQVRGEIPSYMLHGRLNKALEVLSDHPEAVVVVTGGQGRGERITEAEAMRRYLERNGISPERIYMEEKSTSTEENMVYSAEILRGLGITENIAVVTNEFHQYRAGIYAKRAGLVTGHYSAPTSIRTILNNWIREWAALLFVGVE